MDRDTYVMAGLQQGKSLQKIGEELGVSRSTVHRIGKRVRKRQETESVLVPDPPTEEVVEEEEEVIYATREDLHKLQKKIASLSYSLECSNAQAERLQERYEQMSDRQASRYDRLYGKVVQMKYGCG